MFKSDSEKIRDLEAYLKSDIYQDFKKHELLFNLFYFCLLLIVAGMICSICVEAEKLHFIKENARWGMGTIGTIVGIYLGRRYERGKIKNKLDIIDSDVRIEEREMFKEKDETEEN